jgi:hypothetical protein
MKCQNHPAGLQIPTYDTHVGVSTHFATTVRQKSFIWFYLSVRAPNGQWARQKTTGSTIILPF